MEPIMTISYTPEKRDYIRAARILSKKSPWCIVLGFVIVVLVVAAGIVMILPNAAGNYLQGLALFVFVAGLVYMVYNFFLIPIQLSKAYQTKPHLSMTRSMTFFESHLMMRIGEQSVDLPWENLEKVIDGGDYFLMLFRGDEQVFPFIPDRAINNHSVRVTLIEFIKAHAIPVL